MKKLLFYVVLAVVLVACERATVVEVRVFAASSRNALKGAVVSVLLKNPATGQDRQIQPVAKGTSRYSFKNYRRGKAEFVQVTVRLDGYRTFVESYTNLEYLDRNNRSPYQRFLDVYLRKAGE